MRNGDEKIPLNIYSRVGPRVEKYLHDLGPTCERIDKNIDLPGERLMNSSPLFIDSAKQF